jgi:DNA polymerase III psi subunit
MAYLEAMDISVWQLRSIPRAAEPDLKTTAPEVQTATGLKLGPGSGGTLLLCADPADSATRLANDIVRALGSVPVWAWPETDAKAIGLAEAIEEHLFTTVAIFGDGLARQLFDNEIPASLKAAKLVPLPSMQDVQQQADARRALWDTFCRSGMVHMDPV